MTLQQVIELMVKRHQREAADAVGRAIMRLTLMPQGKQTTLFRDSA